MKYSVERSCVPDLPPGTVLRFAVTEWRYGLGPVAGEPFELLITRVRVTSAPSYDGEWVWVDGHHLDCRPDHRPCQQALVSVAALWRATPPAEQVVDGAARR